ncbi:fimbrial protein [Paraburkholderia dinghuensis]|uniref:Fimbrial protein n=1 Tax=Paraburkholderia dinghuensis TaxID=2305225 RepID=A0A3N6N975_9BURK|nr:fimbrial protein [Paraburkholderia dinghuensis]RQH04727.1 fimbrial protein [Paraburkholderia dinghuensis]
MNSWLVNLLLAGGRAGRCARLVTLLSISAAVTPTGAWAQSTSTGCWKITTATSSTTSYLYTDPGAIVGAWTGSTDTAGQGAFPMTINVNVPAFVPNGTLIGSAISPVYNLGSSGVGSYNPEQILFRCSPNADGTIYEFYGVNGDDAYSGNIDVSGTSGIPGTFRSYYTGVVFRLTNIATGNYLSRSWQARPLTGLDRDSQNWILVKAKNFSQYQMEMFQCTVCQAGATSGTGTWTYVGPLGYVAFVGGATGSTSVIQGNLTVGSDTATHYDGWYGTWPGAIAAYNTVIVRRNATCAVTNATPVVLFPTITTVELNHGGSRQVPVTIQVQCQSTTPSGMSAFASGTAANQTALGILASPANAQSATNAGLTTSGTGVTYLLSDNYGTPGIASGVGVALSRPNGTALNFLTNQFVTTGGAASGWDAVLNDATADGPASGGFTSYTRTIYATFKAFAPGSTPVTPGRYDATATVIVRVQ